MNVELTDGTTVELKPCPVWCLGDHDEFPPGTPVSPVIVTLALDGPGLDLHSQDDARPAVFDRGGGVPPPDVVHRLLA